MPGKADVASQPAPTPMRLPAALTKALSIKIWPKMSNLVAPMARRVPILTVLSFTEIQEIANILETSR